MKTFLRDVLMTKFLTELYNKEIKAMESHGGVKAWCSVAHCAQESSSMNVAMPDMSCEYWCCYVPSKFAPLFEVKYPQWGVYSALTVYDCHGLPLASFSCQDASNLDVGKRGSRWERGGDIDGDIGVKKKGDTVVLNLMKGVDYAGPVCVLFRVYRPLSHSITPEDALPKTFFIPRKERAKFDFSTSTTSALVPVPQAERKSAFATGKRIESTFCALIQKHMKPLRDHQFGTQAFHPNSVSGLFVNANATYVICFKPCDKVGMKMKAKVPNEQDYRPYYGIMTVEYESTQTMTSRTFEQLGGWGSDIEVFVTNTKEEAIKGGYDEKQKSHHWLSLRGKVGCCGMVLRYLHYFEVSDALKERENLSKMDGSDILEERDRVEGVGRIEYF